LENERLQKDAAVFQLFCEIGHDLSRSLGAISSLISCLDYEIKRAPHVEMIFWNSEAGDYLKRMLQKKNDLKRFARDVRSIGSPVSPNFNRINLHSFIDKRLSEFKLDWQVRGQEQALKTTRVYDPRQEDIEGIEDIVDYDRCQEDIIVNIDADYIGRALDALLDNAMHAVSRVSRACIIVATKIEAHPGGSSFVSISISDNGQGVPEGQKERIFLPFVTTRGGAGLGLASARRYVKAHGGTLLEVGEYGKGAVFVLKLPLEVH
jgi:signal transduction histidine kinase